MRFKEVLTEYRGNNNQEEDLLFEMSNLESEETGLPFDVFASPRGNAKHDIRIKVTILPWQSHPIAVYGVRPCEFIEGTDWLNPKQESDLKLWVNLNLQTLIDFWNNKIIGDKEFRSKLVGINDAPPADWKSAVGALRILAPKVKMIQWKNNTYHLIFDAFIPSIEKINKRFTDGGFTHPLNVSITPINDAIDLWG